MKISRKESSSRLEMEKRCRVPFVVEDACPECGASGDVDLEDHYLSYPVLGEPSKVYFSCETCDADWTAEVVLDVTLSPAQRPT